MSLYFLYVKSDTFFGVRAGLHTFICKARFWRVRVCILPPSARSSTSGYVEEVGEIGSPFLD
jgi:hypothetical protein